MIAARSRFSPLHQASFSTAASRMCSRLCTGSASTPSSVNTLVAVVVTASAIRSESSRSASDGALNDSRIETGRPARLPGV